MILKKRITFKIFEIRDLIVNKEFVIKKIIKFFYENFNTKINNINTRLENILETTSFDYMKKAEIKNSFDEAMPWSRFFQEGKKELWKDVLKETQRYKIEDNFRDYMNKFGYQ